MNGVQVADDEELLAVLDELCDIFAEEGERRIGNDDIRLLQEFYALGGTEVSVAFKACKNVLVVLDEPFHVSEVDASVSVHVPYLVDDDLVGNPFVLHPRTNRVPVAAPPWAIRRSRWR